MPREREAVLEDDPLWYKDAVLYELHVRAFQDSDDDGIGDFRGLTARLDYLSDLGVTAIWLLPFYPSPLRDDGYDIADYTGVNPAYGSLSDFRRFLREAHARGLRVITELVINHTSDQHGWFQRARRARPGSAARDFYVWSDSPDRYADARIIFKDFETSNWSWDPVARAHYWHRFYHHQPDLNFENPRVEEAVLKVMEFWLRMGVDGLRLDAVPYLFEREGTNCENLPETHAALKRLRARVDERFTNRMLLAEANQWPEDAIAYFGDGDECQMAFHFPIMPRLFMALHQEDRYPILDILAQTPPIPDPCQWALFLRNHDELTLEMVTDEERDYMYRVYANDPKARINLGIRRRLAPLLGSNRRKIELLNGLLFSLPGTPIIYYGDELGMGDNFYLGDRNGVRTPMQWSPDRNAGFSRANPQQLYLPVISDPEYHFEAVNVESQQRNPNSLLWWMKRLIALRRRFKAFSRGNLVMLTPDNPKVVAFIRSWEDERILVLANLSRFVQHVELDLNQWQGTVPVELFGRTEFPPVVGSRPYVLTLGPHAFYWFALTARDEAAVEVGTPAVAELSTRGRWQSLLTGRGKRELETVLSSWLPERRWFGGKSRKLKSVAIAGNVPLNGEETEATLLLLDVDFVGEESQRYLLPVTMAAGDAAAAVERESPQSVIARCTASGHSGVLVDAMAMPSFASFLLAAVARGRRFKGAGGEVAAAATAAFRRLGGAAGEVAPSPLRSEQSNTSVVYGQRFVLKLFRRLEKGVNPDLEVGRYLTRTKFPHIPAVAGALELQRPKDEGSTLAILQEFVPNQGDAWSLALDTLGRYLERVSARSSNQPPPALPAASLLGSAREQIPADVRDAVGTFLERARVLGRRTAELHLALAAPTDDPAFAPEPFSLLFQRSLNQSMRSQVEKILPVLSRRLRQLPEVDRPAARRVLDAKDEILERFGAILGGKISAQRTRTHGDYHLGQVLYTGKDFVIIDFEGEPARPVSERRIKRSPLRDVAGMLRSFHYAAYAALFGQVERGLTSRDGMAPLEQWVGYWNYWVSVAYLAGYLEVATGGSFLPHDDRQLGILLDAYLLEKAVYELGYELDNRPDWLRIPVHGILQLVQEAAP